MLRPLTAILSLACVTFTCVATPPPSPVAVATLTAEEFFRNASLGQAELSPDGQHLGAIITDEKDLHHLFITDLKEFKPNSLRGDGDFDLSTFHWLGNDRLLFNVTREKLYSWGLFTVKLGRMNNHYALNSYDVTRIIGLPRARAGRVIAWIVQSAEDRGQPGKLLELDANRIPDSSFGSSASRDYAVVRTYPAPKNGIVIAWNADHDGELALSYTWTAGHAHLHRYLRSQDAWREVPIDLETVSPMALDPDNRFLWVVTHSAAHGYELRRCDLDTGALAAPVHTDPLYDLGQGHLYFSERTHDLAGISYIQRKRATVHARPPDARYSLPTTRYFEPLSGSAA